MAASDSVPVPRTLLLESVKVTVPAAAFGPLAANTIAAKVAVALTDKVVAATKLIVVAMGEELAEIFTEARIPPLSFDAFKERFATPEFCGVHE